MRTIPTLTVLLGAVLIIAPLEYGDNSPSPPERDGQIDAIFAPLNQPDEPGLAVLVQSKGQFLFEKAFGLRDLRTHAKNSANTNFRLASFTKQFTAMAIMLLVHDGKLRYDDRLPAIFPEFPASGNALPIPQLPAPPSRLPASRDLLEKQ